VTDLFAEQVVASEKGLVSMELFRQFVYTPVAQVKKYTGVKQSERLLAVV
jgi:hypothetical protein